jgi:hypothetical protein
MKKRKPFRVLEEYIKYHFIVIELFKKRKIFPSAFQHPSETAA